MRPSFSSGQSLIIWLGQLCFAPLYEINSKRSSYMTKNFWIGSEVHRIRVNEIDDTKTATLPALVNLMQEVAWNNSTNLKYSVYDLMEHGVTWVVYRMQIHIKRYPRQQESITVKSWPSGMDRLYTYRDYKILDDRDQEIVRATSAWLVMDIKKRELVSVPNFIREGLDFAKGHEQIPLDRTKLLPVNNTSRSYQTEVGIFNMDVNGHVYNTYYFQWLLESMADLKSMGRKVNYIDIQFKGESRNGDILSVISEEISKDAHHHQILNADTETELIRAKTQWATIEQIVGFN